MIYFCVGFYTGASKNSNDASFAVPIAKKDEPINLEIADFQPEVKDESNWYVSMGIGQLITYSLRGFVRVTFWSDGPPIWLMAYLYLQW